MKTCVYCLQPIEGEALRLIERPKPGKRVEYVHPDGCPERVTATSKKVAR